MKKCLILAVLLAISGILAPIAHAAIVFQDNFNSENGGSVALNYNRFVNWNVTSQSPATDGTVDLIGSGYSAFDIYPGNGLYVDLSGSTNSNGILSTKSAFAAGTYTLSFNLSPSTANVRNTVYISLGNWNTIIDCSGPSSGVYNLYTYLITITQGASLSFYDVAGTNRVGAILDNVVLDSVDPVASMVSKTSAAPAPEPSTMLLLGAGLLGLATFRKKIKK